MKMKTKIAMLLVLFAACGLVILPGCLQPPEGTVFVDTDGDGVFDALAPDADGDGKADLDEKGEPKIIEGSKGYRTAEAIDAVLPIVLTTIGTILGGGGLAAGLLAGGAAWKKSKLARIVMNLVMSIQAGREELKTTPKMQAALAIVDKMLKTAQSPETEAMVMDVKKVIKAAKDAKVAEADAEAA